MDSKTDAPVIYGGNAKPNRSTKQALWRGMKKTCPRCGAGDLFGNYTAVREACDTCDLDYSGQRADDAPPYFTMLIAGHLVIPLALETKRQLDPPLALQFLIWSCVLALLIWLLLPITKGGLIGIQWANRMHGFSDTGEDQTGADPSDP